MREDIEMMLSSYISKSVSDEMTLCYEARREPQRPLCRCEGGSGQLQADDAFGRT